MKKISTRTKIARFFAALLLTMTAATVSAQSGTLVLDEDFENGLPSDWTFIDADGDGYGWDLYQAADHVFGYESDCSLFSASYYNGVALTPDNHAFTPELNLPSGGILTFYVAAQDPNYPYEHISVHASDNNYSYYATALYEETLQDGEWKQVTVNIPAGTKHIVFRHSGSTDQFRIKIDNVKIYANNANDEVYYGIKIGGKDVTSKNCMSINAENGFTAVKSGNIVFDRMGDGESLMRFKDVVIDNEGVSQEGVAAIRTYNVEGADEKKLVIWLEGENIINWYNNADAIISELQLVLSNGNTPDGDLTITTDRSGIFMRGGRSLILMTKADVTIESERWGLTGNFSETLDIRDATVRTKGAQNGSITDFKEILLAEGTELVSPIGAVIDGGDVKLNGDVCKEQVVITNNPTAINEVTMSDNVKEGIYTIDGRKLNADFNSLPKGVYIVNGKKMNK